MNEKGQRHGQGLYQFVNGERYEGGWVENKKQGFGRFFYLNGEMYAGNWLQDVKSGQGEYYFIGGTRYQGEWLDNLRHGQGTILYDDFSESHGSWVNGVKHGRFVLKTSDGREILEHYDHGKLTNRTTVKNKKSKSSEDSTEQNFSNYSALSAFEHCEDFIKSSKCSPVPQDWSPFQVRAFITHIGLPEYSSKFFENSVDGKKLMSLSEQDMSDLGMDAKGHRMTMRETILRLQKVAYFYKRKFSPGGQTFMQTTASNRSLEDKISSYYTKVNMIQEVEEDITSMTNKSVVEHSLLLRQSFSSVPRKNRAEHVDGGMYFLNSRHKRLRASSAIEAEIVKEYCPVRAFDDSRRQLYVSRIKKFDIEEIDIFQPECEDHEQISHMGHSSASSKSESRTSSSSSSLSSEIDPRDCPLYIADWEIEWGDPLSKKSMPLNLNSVNLFRGRVYNQEVVIKAHKKTSLVSTARKNKLVKEAYHLSELNHPHIVMFIGMSSTPKEILHITEFMEQRSLFEAIHSDHIQLTAKCIYKMLEDVASALTFLHSKKQIHGNLKSKTVLLSNNFTFKVNNFGREKLALKLKRLKRDKLANIHPFWMPPETLLFEEADCKSDVYSFGMLIWESIEGRTPLVGISLEELREKIGQTENISQHFLGRHHKVYNELVEVMRKCLSSQREARPTSMELFREVKKLRFDKFLCRRQSLA